jgi:hypothetical protein
MRPGDAVYLKPGSARLKIKQKVKQEVITEKIDDVDEELYPDSGSQSTTGSATT